MKDQINPYKLFVGSFIPNWLLQRTEISSNAKLVYARLCQYAGANGEAFPKIDTLAKETGLSSSAIDRAVAELKKVRLIESLRRGFTQSNIYIFLRHKWMSGHHETPEVVSLETPKVTSHETPKMVHIRESSEENHLKSPAKRGARKDSGWEPEDVAAQLKQLRESLPDSTARGRAN